MKKANFLFFYLVFQFAILSNVGGTEEHITEWTQECFSQLPEVARGIFATHAKYATTNILPVDTFENSINGFIEKLKIDTSFNNKDHWNGFDDTKTPAFFFDEIPNGDNITNFEDYSHPYVQKLITPKGSIICFMGDIHGSLHSLLRNLWRLIVEGYLDHTFKITKENFFMVFLGDYIDRGGYSIMVLYTLLQLKLANWNNVFLIRGNHESLEQAENQYYLGLRFELETYYDNENIFRDVTTKSEYFNGPLTDLGKKIHHFFNLLPLALYIGTNNIFIKCCHGAFAPHYNPNDFLKGTKLFERINPNQPHEHSELPAKLQPLVDATFIEEFKDDLNLTFTWTDIRAGNKETQLKHIASEGTGRPFAHQPVVTNFNEAANLKALFRGHQHSGFGLKMYKNLNDQRGITKVTEGDHWSEVVTNTEADGSFFLKDYFPVFTLSTAATGVMLNYDCFTLLTTDDAWDNWKLKPYEFNDNFDTRIGTYITIKKSSKTTTPKSPALTILSDPLEITFEETPPKKPIADELITIAQTNQLSQLKQKITYLKMLVHTLATSLGNVQTKLTAVNSKLSTLAHSKA